jgi:hypothetical protein
MRSSRLEAFSDAAIAVVITIRVLNLHPPPGSSLHDLRPLVPTLSVYLLSFVLVALYWNNHHHLLQVADRVSGAALGERTPSLLALSHSRDGGLARPSPRRHHSRRRLRRRTPRRGNRRLDPHPHVDRRPRTRIADRPNNRPGREGIPLTAGVCRRNCRRACCALAFDRVLLRSGGNRRSLVQRDSDLRRL